MRAVKVIFWIFCSICFFAEPALAERRVALIIGNSAYQSVARLGNPANDSEAIAATLKDIGFDVVDLKRDLNAAAMRRALRDFADSVRDADVALVYYAGHGIEINGDNYLIPVDAVLERDIDAFDEAIALERILRVVQPAKQLRLVILDACRDNPFNTSMKRSMGSRGIGRGLAKVDPENPNTLIAFAAKAGSTALDGDSKNSPYTTALVKYLPKPGLDLRKAFGYVRDDVLKVTSNKQEPFIYGSLGGADVSLVPAVIAPPAATADSASAERRDYELSERVGTREGWDAFLSQYPNGFYARLAQAQRNKLAAEEARVAAVEKARTMAEERERLAAEGAKAKELAKAAQQAKAAEEARIAAEKKKAAEDARLAEAERAKAAAQAKADEEARLAAGKKRAAEEAKANQERIAAERKLAEEAKVVEKAAEAERVKAAAALAKAAEQTTLTDKPIGQIAALTPPDQASEAMPKSAQPVTSNVPRLLQTELQRVGCGTGTIEDNWSASAQKALGLFNKNAGTKFDVKVASVDALEVLRSKPARVCTQVCEQGFKADGDSCTKIVCKAGYEVGDDNICEKIETRRASRPKPAPVRSVAEKPAAPKQASSQPTPDFNRARFPGYWESRCKSFGSCR
jgi:uncharacterized caspase-like protein